MGTAPVTTAEDGGWPVPPAPAGARRRVGALVVVGVALAVVVVSVDYVRGGNAEQTALTLADQR